MKDVEGLISNEQVLQKANTKKQLQSNIKKLQIKFFEQWTHNAITEDLVTTEVVQIKPVRVGVCKLVFDIKGKLS